MVERVNWKHLLNDHVTNNLQRHVNDIGQTEGGRLVHNWIENEFEDELPLDFEVSCEYGRYDAGDEECIYEFKTKHPEVYGDKTPYDRDVRQVEKYLESGDVDSDFGILVYINRGELTEVEEYLVNGSVTKLS